MSGARQEDGSNDKPSQAEKKDSDRGWMKQEDMKILEMKKNGATWMEIAIAVQRSKKDVQTRYKELNVGEEEQKKKEEKETKSTGATPARRSLDAELTNNPEFAAFLKTYLGGTDGKKPDSERKPPRDNTSTHQVHHNCCSHRNNVSQGPSSSSTTPRSSGGWYQHDWNQNQRPAPKFLRPDLIWSREDCETLEMLEEQYIEHKWLHLQAKFFNWTGRMIPAELIQQKFEADRGY